MPQPGQQPVYYRAFQFLIEIDGVTNARFQEVGGIDATVDVIEYREGGNALGPRLFPGQTKHSRLSLKRGYTDDSTLYTWFEDVMTGRTENIRRNISIVQIDMNGAEVFRWNLYKAFPVKYTAPAFNAKGNDISIETLEVAYERIERH
ncbi:MAG TPA: phage tail protein [Candidatus Angelobacter sp.]|jgi:phage tail-like protein|nr:phage tail protein [Candidatus Angelobacter sp.]